MIMFLRGTEMVELLMQLKNYWSSQRWSVTPVAAAIASDVRNNWIGVEVEFGLREKFLP